MIAQFGNFKMVLIASIKIIKGIILIKITKRNKRGKLDDLISFCDIKPYVICIQKNYHHEPIISVPQHREKLNTRTMMVLYRKPD